MWQFMWYWCTVVSITSKYNCLVAVAISVACTYKLTWQFTWQCHVNHNQIYNKLHGKCQIDYHMSISVCKWLVIKIVTLLRLLLKVLLKLITTLCNIWFNNIELTQFFFDFFLFSILLIYKVNLFFTFIFKYT